MEINKSNVNGDYNIIVQGENNNILMIDSNNKNQISQSFISNNIFPTQSVSMNENKNGVPTTGAKVYLGVNYMFETMYGRPTGNIEGVCLGVTVTNLNVVHRYFSQPSFKVSVPLDGGKDTFSLLDVVGERIAFPKRLEYGESYTIYYKLASGALGIMKSLMKKDAQMNIMAFVTTSLGEYFESNKHLISELTERI